MQQQVALILTLKKFSFVRKAYSQFEGYAPCINCALCMGLILEGALLNLKIEYYIQRISSDLDSCFEVLGRFSQP